MKTDLKLITVCLIVGVLFTNCGKKGCTNKDAINYDSKAKKDDGTCKYEGSVMFWMDGSVTTNGAVDVMVDGQVKQITIDITSGTPSCGQSGCANFTKLPVGTYNWTAEDQFPVSYQNSGTVEIKANVCTRFKLN